MFLSWKTTILTFLYALFFAVSANAVPTSLSFQTKIFKPDGQALEAASVNFRFTTVDSTGTCILYVEDFNNKNMQSSTGTAVFNLGAGAKVYPTAAYIFTDVFSNTQPSFTCQNSATFTPTTTDTRKIIAQFHDGSAAGWQTLPPIDVNSVPYASFAGEAAKLSGFSAIDFMQKTSNLSGLTNVSAARTNLGLGSTSSPTFTGLTITGGVPSVGKVLTSDATGVATWQVPAGAGSGSGTVTSLSVIAANGFSGTVANPSTTPAITLSTNVTGVLKGNGSAISAAVAGDFPILNQNTTGTAANVTGIVAASNGGTGVTTAVNNTFFAGPSAGGPLAPSFRALAANDIPNLSTTYLPLAGGTMTGALVNNTSSASAAVAVTQAGTGAAATFMGGNVGIGTTTPSRTLEVNAITSGVVQRTMRMGTDGLTLEHALVPATITINSSGNNISAPTSVSYFDQLGGMQFNAWDGTSFVPTASMRVRAGPGVSTGTVPSQFEFHTTGFGATSASQRLTIGSSGVGINTPNTQVNAGLEVNSSNNTFTALFANNNTALSPNYIAFNHKAGSDTRFQFMEDTMQFWNLFVSSQGFMIGGYQPTPNTAGAPFYLWGMDAAYSATDKAGGTLFMGSGQSTGTGTSNIEFQTATPQASGTTTNTRSTKMILLGNGNVGIGTSTPAAKLQVGVAPTATANFPVFALGTAPFDGLTAGFFTGSANGTFFGVNAATGYTGDLVNLQIAGVSRFKVDASGNITNTGTTTTSGNTTSSGNYSTTGNISTTGVGTITSAGVLTASSGAASTSPSSGSLIVTGGAGISGALNVGSNIVANGNIATAAAVAATAVTNQNSPNMYLTANYWNGTTSAVDQWSIQNILGVGANPTSTLQFGHTGSTGAAQYAFMNGNVGIGIANPTSLIDVRGASTGSVSLNLQNTTYSPGASADINFAHNGIVGSKISSYLPGGNVSNLIFSTSSDSVASSERMRIDGNGSVGIGTTTSSGTATLELATIFNSGGTKALIIRGPAGDNNWGGGINLTSANGTSNDSTIINNSGGLNLTNTKATAMMFSTNNTEKMRILSNGNVGIGTTAPIGLLEVRMDQNSGTQTRIINAASGITAYTELYVGQNSAGGQGVMLRYANTGNGAWGSDTGLLSSDGAATGGMVVAAGGANPLRLFTNNNERLRIDPTGNVGIGTTTPRSRFEVVAGAAGSTFNNSTYTGGGSGNPGYGWQYSQTPGSGGGNALGGDAGGIFLGGAAADNVAGGGAGIYAAGGTANASANGYGYGGAGIYAKGGSNGVNVGGTAPAGYFEGTLISTGNVGIGNTSPSYTLDVTGTMRVTGQAYTTTGNGSFTILSDARYKDVHGSFNRGLEALLNVNTIRYNYVANNPLGSDPTQEYVGVTAQNLQTAIPEAVKEKDGYLTVNTSPVLWTLVNAVKELYSKLVGHDEQLVTQAREIASVKAGSMAKDQKILQLEQENAEIKARLDKIEKALNSK